MRLKEIRAEKIIAEPPLYWLNKSFGVIVIYPEGATFATQNENEDVVIVLRKHIIRNTSWLLTAIMLLLLPAIISMLLVFVDGAFFENSILQSDILLGVNNNFMLVFVLFYYGFVFSYTIFKFLHWYYDLFIITNERFISIDFDSLKGKVITDIPLVDVVDIREKALGVVPTLLGYATIEFKTLSELKMIIDGIPQATWFRDSFADLIKAVRSSEQFETEKERAMNEVRPREKVANQPDALMGKLAERISDRLPEPEATATSVEQPPETSQQVSAKQQLNKNIEP
jgi:hypothetical protein